MKFGHSNYILGDFQYKEELTTWKNKIIVARLTKSSL